MADRRYDFKNDGWLNWVGPRAEGAVLLAMDEFAKELFGLWLSGDAPKEVIFDDAKWAAYMAANQRLSDQIDAELTKFAEAYRDWHVPMTPVPGPQLQKSNPAARCGPSMVPMAVPHQPYFHRFHAEIGGSHGGYRTGYDQLHGTDRTVGDFEIRGMMHVGRVGSKLEFTFRNNQMTFNDIVNPNAKYKSDVVLARLAANLKASTGGRPPKDYIARIRWREPGPWTYTIAAAVQ